MISTLTHVPPTGYCRSLAMERPSSLAMEQVEFEFLAREARRMARIKDDEAPLAIDIAERLLGRGCVVYGSPALPPRLVGSKIIVPPGHPDLNFAVAHELGEWMLQEVAQFRGDALETERAANSVGAAMLAPPSLVREAHRHFGERLRAIARVFGLSQTAVVLRIAEVENGERGVVTRTGNVLLRAHRLDPAVLVEVARLGLRVKGLVRAQLRGGIDEGRIAVRVR